MKHKTSKSFQKLFQVIPYEFPIYLSFTNAMSEIIKPDDRCPGPLISLHNPSINNLLTKLNYVFATQYHEEH